MMNRKSTVMLSLIIYLLIIPYPNIYGEKQPEMKVHFIDVGQGDSILLETPADKYILIDGGLPKAGKKVVTYLKKLGVNKIDLLIATHPDIDHIGGLPYVMKSIKVNQIMDSGKFYTTKTYARYINEIHQQEIPMSVVRLNEQINLDPSLKIKVLNTFERRKSNNESSIVLKVSFNQISFLFMGDVGHAQEKHILNTYRPQADFIKIAHHGSRTSSSLRFLQAVNPEVAFITYSRENDYGHPVSRVIRNLDQLNISIYSTAVYGDIIVRTNGTSYFIEPKKSPIDGLLKSM